MTDRLAPQQVATGVSDTPSRAPSLMQTLLRSEWPWMLYLAFAVLLVVFSLASPWFLSIDNFLNIGRQTTLVSIVAIGMTFVIIAGQIDMMFDSVPTMAPMIETGRVKALGTSGRVRSAALPNVPTLKEAGLPGYEATPWGGVMAPAGTPEVIIDKLNTEIKNILALPHVREVWRAQGADPVIMTPSEFGVFIQSEIERWAKIIKANGIKGD